MMKQPLILSSFSPAKILALALGLGVAVSSFSQSAQADQTWDFGAATQDWNNSINWSNDTFPNATNAIVNTATAGQFPILSSGVSAFTPTKIYIGTGGSSNTGRFDITTATTGTVLSTGKLYIGGAPSTDNGNGTMTINTSGTVNVTDTTNFGGLNASIVLGTAFGGSATGTLNLQNGTLNSSGEVIVGRVAGTSTTSSLVNQTGGTFNSAGLVTLGYQNYSGNGMGTYTISAGQLNANAGLKLSNDTGTTGTVNLNGGTIQTTQVTKGSGTGTFNFNGGTLKAGAASTTFMTGLTAANVQNGGAIVDTNTFDVTIAQALLANGAGGLTKNGAGTLILSGANTYTGGTTVTAGTLQIGSGANVGTLGVGGTVTVGGATLLFGQSGTNTNAAFANDFVFNAGSTVSYSLDGRYTLGSSSANTAGSNTIAVNGATTFSGLWSDKPMFLGGVVSGTDAITVQRQTIGVAGTNQVFGLNFLNNSNTYSGTITTSGAYSTGAGGIIVGGSTALQFASVVNNTTGGGTNSNGVVFNVTSATLGSLAGSGNIILTANTNTIGGSGLTPNTNGGAVALTAGGNGGSTTYSGVMSGLGSLTKTGAGTVTLSGANTYTGATTVNAGTLKVDNNNTTTARLANTSGVTVNNGGTLLLAQSGATPTSADRINNNATVTLAGGTFDTGGLSEGSVSGGVATAGLGALTLSANSILDLGSDASILAFADSSSAAWTASTTLTIYNWSGNPAGGGTDEIFFGNSAAGLTPTQLGQISFFSGAGTGALGSATILSNGEIVPVPEPSTIFGMVVLVGLAGYRERKRVRAFFARAGSDFPG